MRAVARLGERGFPLYGSGPYEASRVDSFLDASLVFARDGQAYLLSLLGGAVSSEIQSRARDALDTYLRGISRALHPGRAHLVGDGVTLADICFAAELGLFSERAGEEADARGARPSHRSSTLRSSMPRTRRAFAHFGASGSIRRFAPDVEPYMEKIERAR
jgi:elongation factor 1-gamma